MLHLKELLSLKLLIPYISGILVWWFFPHQWDFRAWHLLSFLPILYLCSLQKANTWFSQVISITVVFSFLFFTGYHCARSSESDLSSHREFSPGAHYGYGKILSVKEKNNLQYVLRLSHLESINKKYQIGTNERIIVYDTERKNRYSKGDLIFFQANLNRIKPAIRKDDFDFKKYYRSQGIYYNAWMTKSNLHKHGMFFSVHNLSVHWATAFQSGFSQKTGALLQAMLLGKKGNLSDNVVDVFRKSGAIHVLAISGLHAGIILGICMFFFNLIFGMSSNSKILSQGMSLVCVWIFALLVGWQIPVVRTAALLTLYIFGRWLNRDIHPIQTLTIGIFFLLLFDPLMLFQISFQFSVLAVLGIVVCYRKIVTALTIPGFRWLNPVTKLISVSIAAQVFLFPLILYYFGQFPVYFWLSSLIAVPITTLLLICGFIWSACYAIHFNLGVESFELIIEYLVNSQVTLLDSITELPSSLLSGLHINGIQTLFILVIMALISWPFKARSKWNLHLTTLFAILLIGYSSWNLSENTRKVEIYLAHDEDGVLMHLKDQSQTYKYQITTNARGQVSLYDTDQKKYLPDQFQNNVLFRNNHFLQFRNYKIAIDPQYITSEVNDLSIDLAIMTKHSNRNMDWISYKNLISDFKYRKTNEEINLRYDGYQIIEL